MTECNFFYQTPLIEVVDVTVEQGFASSDFLGGPKFGEFEPEEEWG